MTQTDEARELMGCRRCGRYAGPELLCTRCEQDLVDEYEASRPAMEQALREQERGHRELQTLIEFIDWAFEDDQ